MRGTRFDALARLLVSLGTRRGAFVVGLTGTLGLLGFADPDAAWGAKSGKCKQKCGPCEKCDKGKCEKKNGKKRCRAGKCKPKANGTPCAGGTCQGGRCSAGTPFCAGKNICQDGNTTLFTCHQSGTPECVCVANNETGAPFCALSPVTNDSCKPADPCPAGQTCVDNTGGLCSGGTAKCARPCPSPL